MRWAICSTCVRTVCSEISRSRAPLGSWVRPHSYEQARVGLMNRLGFLAGMGLSRFSPLASNCRRRGDRKSINSPPIRL